MSQVPFPRYQAPAGVQDIPPHKYIVMLHSQRCKCCGGVNEWSEVFALTHLKSTLGHGKYVTNLRAVEEPKWNLPIAVQRSEPTVIPFCHRCHQPSLANSGLPEPPKSDPQKVPTWLSDRSKGPNANVTPKTEPAKGKKVAPTVDSLLEMIK